MQDKFVLLTRFYFKRPENTAEGDDHIWLATDQIVTMQRHNAGLNKYTEIVTTVGSFNVEEMPEQVFEALNKLKESK